LFQKMDQRICIKFCVKNKIKCADAFRMLTVAYGEATLDRSNVYRWYKMFSEGREDVNDEERAGSPSTSTTDENIDEVKKIVLANRRITETGRREIRTKIARNAPAHTSLLVREFLAKNNTLMMPQPPYSPDLVPCDFFLFPKLKRPMKGRRRCRCTSSNCFTPLRREIEGYATTITGYPAIGSPRGDINPLCKAYRELDEE
ncbi:GVQW3 protein, partial [Acromyrmex charruanus]